jgi:hypothetical protein
MRSLPLDDGTSHEAEIVDVLSLHQSHSGLAMVDRRRSLAAFGLAADAALLVVAFQDLLTQAAEVCFILSLERVAGPAQPECDDIHSPARAVQQMLASSPPHCPVYSFVFSMASFSQMNVSTSAALDSRQSHYSLSSVAGKTPRAIH